MMIIPDPTCSDDSELLDTYPITHPHRPLVDDQSAEILDQATVELTLRRSPMALGDGLADLHAMVSLLAQIHAWLPVAIASARNQRHTWTEIAEQLEITPAAARRRHRAYLESTPRQHLDSPPR